MLFNHNKACKEFSAFTISKFLGEIQSNKTLNISLNNGLKGIMTLKQLPSSMNIWITKGKWYFYVKIHIRYKVKNTKCNSEGDSKLITL